MILTHYPISHFMISYDWIRLVSLHPFFVLSSEHSFNHFINSKKISMLKCMQSEHSETVSFREYSLSIKSSS